MVVPAPFSPEALAVAAPTLASSRLALHRLAFYVLSASRQAATGRIGLRSAPGGFGTPPFPDADGRNRVLRVEGTDLIVETDGDVERQAITTLGAAAELVGIVPDAGRGAEFDVPPMGALDEPLTVDVAASSLLAEWYAFGTAALEIVPGLGGPDDDATEAQLWPEHFDVGVDMGSADAGRRASYGASPGGEQHAEPYIYVAAWSDVDDDPFWNDAHFNGASVGLAELAAHPDPAELARSFLSEGSRLLARS
jgi:hypothetical protein